MKRITFLFTFTFVIFFCSTIKAEGQEALLFFFDFISFIIVFVIWIIFTFLLLVLVKKIRKEKFTKKHKYTTWVIALCLAFVHWELVKHDPNIYEKPVDRFFLKRTNNKPYKVADGKSDSTIEYIYSDEKADKGVYIWLDNQMKFVRSFTTDEMNGGEINVNLTNAVLKKMADSIGNGSGNW